MKILVKICKNGDFRNISSTFGRKKLFSKIGLCHDLSIPNTHLCAINQKKTNDEISRKCLKNSFSGIFLECRGKVTKILR